MEQVCVTGASGYVGAHVVRELLERGYRVRGTVRDPSRPEKVEHLTALPGAADRLELVQADLGAPGSFSAAVAGCGAVLHVASPYVLTVADPQRDLVDPAREGTLNVLRSCKEAGTVRRVVLTSSMAAITDQPRADLLLTEEVWNERSSLTRNPYYFSKVQAERAAWAFVEQEAPGFDLVVINPFLVGGPSLSPALNTSPGVIRGLLMGEFPGILSVEWGFVDVRDVAAAHVRAVEVPEAHGRHVCAAEVLSMRQVVQILRENGYDGYKLPRLPLDHRLGDLLVWLASWAQPAGTGSWLRTHVGRHIRFDHSKIRRELGVSFRPAAESILETAADLTRWGHLSLDAPRNPRRRSR